ncbi:hypothetical protein BC830DRAFT_1107865 [Chytriomyces sp. MP71]|nr:hypothetical protein BC830DRAFT_1107865 [Chytriomyces sp. MP71]
MLRAAAVQLPRNAGNTGSNANAHEESRQQLLQQLPLHNGFAVARIFKYKKPPIQKGQKAPRLNETMPLTMFYHADENIDKCVESLSQIYGVQSERFRRKNEKLHSAQKILLEIVYILFCEIDEDMKSPRNYIARLPPDDQRELTGAFSENIYFAAQALSKGYRIRGIEQYTSELIGPAKQLAASMDALRFVFRNRAVSNPMPPHHDLFPVLKDFDASWTAFEQKICFFYFSATYSGLPSRIDETHLFQVLMSESIMRAVEASLVSQDQIESFDPSLILAIPRLSIFSAIYHTPGFVNVTDSQNAFRWFRSKANVLLSARERAACLSFEQVARLEKMLADVESVESQDEDEAVRSIFVDVCSASDCLIRNKEFVGLLSKVFEMHREAK